MTQEEILKCAIVANVLSREESISWGVDCGIDFDANINIALRYLSLLQLQDCGLTKPLTCEIDEFIKFLKNDKIFKCTVDVICDSYQSLSCVMTITPVISTSEGCTTNNMTVQRLQ